jgi:hypothetical protein
MSKPSQRPGREEIKARTRKKTPTTPVVRKIDRQQTLLKQGALFVSDEP